MARLLGPDASGRLVYLATAGILRSAAGRTAVVYTDAAGTVLANIAAWQPGNPGVPGAVITGSQLTIDGDSNLPLFWLPDGADTAWVSVSGGTVTAVKADQALLPLAGGTLTGSLSLQSSAAGGANTSDSTRRITLQTYQRAQRTAADTVTPAHFGEAIRIDLMASDAKGMIAWREGYTPTALSTGPRSVAWAGAHGLANDGLSWHNHWSVEIPDQNGDLQTQLEVPFGQWNVANAYGLTAAAAYVRSIAKFIAGSNLIREGADGTQRDITFGTTDSSNIGGQDSYRRWSLRLNQQVEAPANVGANFELWRRDNTGALLGSGPVLFVKRDTGIVALNVPVTFQDPTARFEVFESGARPVVRANLTNAGTVTVAAFDAVLTSVNNRYFNLQIAAEAATRWSMFGDGRMEWGDGAAARDTNLYRATADVLKTDDSFHVGGHFRHLGAQLGFYNAATITKPTVAGAQGGNTALASLITALVNLGLINNTSA